MKEQSEKLVESSEKSNNIGYTRIINPFANNKFLSSGFGQSLNGSQPFPPPLHRVEKCDSRILEDLKSPLENTIIIDVVKK